MAVDQCEICRVEKSKYKCPKCDVKYCSLKCFKDTTRHIHEELENESLSNSASDSLNKDLKSLQSKQVPSDSSIKINKKFEKILQDETIQGLLKYKAIHYHFRTILQILNDPSLTKEYSTEGRRDIALKKISNLRIGGIEENTLIEEFIERFLSLITGC